MKVELLKCGESLATPGWFFRQRGRGALPAALGVRVPKDRWLRSPIGAFLLVPEDGAKPILVDTGLHPDAITDLASNFGRISALAFSSLKARPQDTVPAQLRARGIEPDELETVVMTHLHVDHASAMSEFPAATFVCSAPEWRAATARFAAWNGYAGGQLPDVGRCRLLEFDGPDAEPYGAFAKTIDLLGDGSVRLLWTPGHTAGHLAVLVAGEDEATPTLIAGDAVYTLRNLREDRLPFRTADDDAYRRSMAELRAFAAATPGAELIPTHDAEVWDRLAGV